MYIFDEEYGLTDVPVLDMCDFLEWKMEHVKEQAAEKIRSIEFDIKKIKNGLFKEFDLNIDDEVTLDQEEYRDDSIHCFSAAQSYKCFLRGIRMIKSITSGERFIAPVLYTKGKNGRPRIRELDYFIYGSWKLMKEGKVMMMHFGISNIIDRTYSDEELKDIRNRYAISQRAV
jgi:hypothetical protein